MSLIHPGPTGVAPQPRYWTVGEQVRIGTIIDHTGQEVQSLLLKPQGIAHVVSRDKIVLPDDICAFAHVLTRRCNEGLLTLNIGVIDPGWDNYISTSILNFSSETRRLEVGQPFMRLTYHQISISDPSRKDSYSDQRNDYSAEVRVRAAERFGKYFLNVRALVAKASDKEAQRIKEASLKFLPIGAFGLTIFALMVSVGTGLAGRLAGQPSNAEISSRLDALDRRLQSSADVNRRLEALEARLPQSQPVGSVQGKIPSGKNPNHEASK